MKKLMQVDLAAVATPVKVKPKRPTKKIEKERPVQAGKSIASFPEKVKKPPTEKQLAAREKMKAARALKLEETRVAKEKLALEILSKKAEVSRKRAEINAKRKNKREQRRAIVKPTITSGPIESAPPPQVNPTISEVLETMVPAVSVVATDPRVEHPKVSLTPPPRPQTPEPEVYRDTEPCEMVRQPPNAPVKAVRFFNYPYGRNIPIQPRFR